MRAAAIFGPGCSIKDVRPFQANSESHWIIGLPAEANEVDAIVIFGGDGTVHRHLPQLAKLRLPVLVVPSGSGNDFARALKLRSIRDSLAAWRKFSSDGHNLWDIDLGLITPLVDKHRAGEAPAPHELLFVAWVASAWTRKSPGVPTCFRAGCGRMADTFLVCCRRC